MRLTTYLHTKARQALPVILATLFLLGCQISTSPTDSIQGNLTQNSAYYLQEAAKSSGKNQIDWQLLAVRALINENNTKQASSILLKLPTNLPVNQKQEKYLLRGELAAKQQDSKAMLRWLKNINLTVLSDQQKARYFQVEVQANQNRDPLAQLRAYINLTPLVSADERQSVIDKTWALLTTFTSQVQNSLVIDANEATLRGWLELLQAYQNNQADKSMLQAAVTDWRTRYIDHPAAQMLPSQLAGTRSTVQSTSITANIALLLPLTGTGYQFGPTIQNGFNAAKNLNAKGAEAQVKVYDTGSKPLAELLAQAEQEGASIIVGPLLKSEVEQLPQSATSLNILALNQPEKIIDKSNICYFALSPEDEAIDAAKHIFSQAKKSPLIIVPRGNFGDRVAKAFAEQWNQLGGNPARIQYFGQLSDLKEAISHGNGMAANGKPIDTASLVGVTTNPESASNSSANLSANNTPADSGAIDAIYIVATQPELALIKPMLDISGASKTAALYASSRSYQAGTGPDFRFEMNGLQFSEIPMLVGLSPAISASGSQYSNDYSQLRLFGMGADAWELAIHFAEIRQQSGFQLTGATGILSADNNCVIHRQLPWIQYHQGQIVPVQPAR
ncbi:MAG: penicillin-binding protein activator [Enterobacteriaceae bacterium]|jgi:outer membrane PBP1 activator LpoA protein|nr:penicillin-binding protein activator [Enterobacteriaceae bacterium]